MTSVGDAHSMFFQPRSVSQKLERAEARAKPILRKPGLGSIRRAERCGSMLAEGEKIKFEISVRLGKKNQFILVMTAGDATAPATSSEAGSEVR